MRLCSRSWFIVDLNRDLIILSFENALSTLHDMRGSVRHDIVITPPPSISPRISSFHRGGPSAHWGGGAQPPPPLSTPVIPGSEIVSQYRMVVLNMWKSKEHKRKVRKVGRFKIWKLKMGETRSKFRDVVKIANMNRSKFKEGEVEEIWQELKETLRKASDEVLGRTNPGRKEQRKSWWWNEDVTQVLKQKKLAFKKWQKSKLE